ncbi:MAG: hypothetical protein HUK09_07880, partial [Bacteroidaceae bacterium]|nr:hypothetical protein [Bacteroidaceae bacterium]
MHYFLLALLLLLGLPTAAQTATPGTWTTHLSYRNGSKSIRNGQWVYGLFEGNLLLYNAQTSETIPVDRLSHGLSARRIADMAYSPSQHCLVLLYPDHNLDLLSLVSGQVRNIPHLKRSTQQEIIVNALNVRGNDLLVATNVGVVWIDLAQAIIRGTYPVGACNDATLFDGKIFAALAAGGIVQAETTANLNDRNQWTAFRSETATRLLATDGRLCIFARHNVASGQPGVWFVGRADATGQRSVDYSGPLGFTDAHLTVDGQLICESWEVLFHYPAADINPLVVRKPNAGRHFEADGQGGYWVSQEGRAIYRAGIEGQDLKMDQPLQTMGNFGPYQDRPYFMRYVGATLWITTGRNDPFDQDHVPQMAMRYDGNWSALAAPTTDGGWAGSLFQDATSLAVDPTRPERIVVTTNRTGIYVYDQSTQPTAQFTHGNSPIRSALPTTDVNYPNYVRTDAAIFDSRGNLFVANNLTDTTLWALTADGRWVGLYQERMKLAPNLERSMIDSRGQLWVTSRRTVERHDGGYLCLNLNGTIGDVSDDRATYRSTFTNQDGTRIAFQQAYAVAEDRDGAIWLGNDQGIFRIEQPDTWHSDNFVATQIKVPRNDGTNYADYLLAGVPVTAIAIDGANRKWVGTDGDGLYLFSPDGLTTVHHFTTANSPLLSDRIWSLAIHPSSSEVMVGT